MSQQLANFASTSLNGAINNSVTSIVVTDGSVFPASGDYYLVIENEIVKVTSRSGNTLTVTRAQESTTAASHSDGSLIKLTLTAQAFEDYFADLHTTGSYASFPSSPRAGQCYHANDMDASWRYTGSDWDMIHPVYVPAAQRMDISSWTSFNLSSSSFTAQAGTVNASLQTSSGDNLRGYYKSVPSAPYTLDCIIRLPPTCIQYSAIGMFWSNGTAYKTLAALTTNIHSVSMSCDQYTNVTTFNSTQFRQHYFFRDYLHLRLVDNNTNWLMQWSADGKNFITAVSVARNTFLTATQVGIFCNRAESTYTSNMEFQFLGYRES